MSVIPALCDDLADELAALDARLAGLAPEVWATPTPAEGWDIALSVSHLCYFDEEALLALTDPAAFDPRVALEATERLDEALGRTLGPVELLDRWRTVRAKLLEAARSADPTVRVPWYGPPMSVASFVSARIMETWAHGTDVSDALGLPPVASGRLRHVCHVGVTARRFAFGIHGVDDPGHPVRVEAVGPDGDLWAWGEDSAADRIEGPALDLALLFTQRRHRNDTGVRVTGSTASAWIAVAQAYAGPPGSGRAPVGG
jgi:uncharacterized protein (TIGR03084 family)